MTHALNMGPWLLANPADCVFLVNVNRQITFRLLVHICTPPMAGMCNLV